MVKSTKINMLQETQDIILRPLQVKTFKACKDAFRKTRRFILKATCGFGKTIIALYMIQRALKHNKRCLFVCDQINLIEQASNTFDMFGVDHGIYQGDNPRFFPEMPVQIASIQTLPHRYYELFDFIVIDEVHTFHKAHIELMKEHPEAFIMGMSASPYTRNLGKHFSFFIEPFTIDQLIEAGNLCPYTLRAPPMGDLKKLKINAGEFTDDSNREVFDKKDILGDVVELWKKHAYGKKTIVFGIDVKHIENIEHEFLEAGIKAVQINAYQSKEEKTSRMNEFKQGDAMILCSVTIAVKGFDFPPVECVIFALATRSKIKWEQGCGRGFRVSPETNKEKALIIDCGGNYQRLGWPDGSGFHKLDLGEKKKEKEPPEPRYCINCQVAIPPRVKVCPECGWDLAPEGVGLPEADKKAELQEYIKPDDSLEYKKIFLGGLNTYAQQKGYKQKKGYYGWALYVFQQKFGKLPEGVSWKTLKPIQPEVKRYIQHQHIKYMKSRKFIRRG
jgi:superfamily II DNA or RNA helicase